jgi:hypothetical protein
MYGHNLIVLREVSQQWNTLAAQLDIHEYAKVVKAKCGNEAAMFCHYVESAIKDGPEYADKHYNEFLNGVGGQYQEIIATRTNKQKTRMPIFFNKSIENAGSGPGAEIAGLSTPTSNLELIGHYLSKEELAEVYLEHGFDSHYRNLIETNKAVTLTTPEVDAEIGVIDVVVDNVNA